MELKMRKYESGFTIIEISIVVAITAIVSVVAVSVLVNSQLRGTRSATLNQVRQEGSFLLDQISFLLRNARYVMENQDGQVCEQAMTAIRVRAADGGVVEVYLDDSGKVASNSGEVISDPPITYLSSDAMIVESLIFHCSQAPEESGARIGVQMTLATGNELTTAPEAFFRQNFSTQVYVRSFQ